MRLIVSIATENYLALKVTISKAGIGFGNILSTETDIKPIGSGSQINLPEIISNSSTGINSSRSNIAESTNELQKSAEELVAKLAGTNTCVRCQKVVYVGEQVRLGPGSTKYHKLCFRCTDCGKSLDSTFSEKKNVIYCKQCHGKAFGTKGIGFGGALTMT